MTVSMSVTIILSKKIILLKETQKRAIFLNKKASIIHFFRKKSANHLFILNQRNGDINPSSAWKRIKVEDELEEAVFVEILDLCAVIRHWLQHFSIDEEYRETNGTGLINF